MLYRLTSDFVGFDIAFIYSKTTLEISRTTTQCFTGYQIDNVLAITMKDPSRIISSIGDTSCKIIRTYQRTFANVTFVTTSD